MAYFEFRNVDGYIKATDKRTSVDTFFRKVDVIIQKTGSRSVSLKSGALVMNVSTYDVAIPSVVGEDGDEATNAFVTTLIDWTKRGNGAYQTKAVTFDDSEAFIKVTDTVTEKHVFLPKAQLVVERVNTFDSENATDFFTLSASGGGGKNGTSPFFPLLFSFVDVVSPIVDGLDELLVVLTQWTQGVFTSSQLTITNHPLYIEVHDATSGKNLFFNKTMLTANKGVDDVYFTLSNGSHLHGTFRFVDVVRPIEPDVDTLITRLLRWAQSTGPIQVDGFGYTKIASKDTIIDMKSTFGISQLRDIVKVVGNGAVTNVPGNEEYELTVASQGDSADLRSVQRGKYVSGKSAEMGIGVRFATQTFEAGQIARFGYFDDLNGFYFKYTNDGISVGVMKDGTSVDIPQAQWNVDRMDGTGASGIELDVTKGNIFQIVYTWYGFGTIVFQVVVTGNGVQREQIVHEYAPVGQTSIKNPNLPINVTLANTDSASAPATLYVAGRQYSVIGQAITSNKRTTSTYRTNVTVNEGGFTPIMSVRRKVDYLGNAIRVLNMEVMVDEDCIYQVRINGVLDTQAFGDIPDTIQSETALELDTTATAVTGGIGTFTGIAAGTGKGNTMNSKSDEFDYVIEDDQIVTLCVSPINAASATINAVLRLSEGW